MKLIVGLGNPGREYENTRHNIGFMVLDNYARVNNFEITKKKFNGLYEKVKIDSQDVIFLKPLSYMNLSGEVVKAFVDYFKINIDDILIINDDLDLEVGKFSNEDLQTYDNIFKISVDIINDFIKSDFDKVMSKYNHK